MSREDTMTGVSSRLGRPIANLLLGSRRAHTRKLARFAEGVRESRVLELGSGKAPRYSARALFHPSNEFITSDVNPEYGHTVIDVKQMEFEEEFHVVLCLNVLEHVFDFQEAIARIHRALRPRGVAIIAVPAFYPLHDEPSDFWRFTEHALRRMLERFDSVDIRHRGLRQYPFSYYAEAHKG